MKLTKLTLNSLYIQARSHKYAMGGNINGKGIYGFTESKAKDLLQFLPRLYDSIHIREYKGNYKVFLRIGDLSVSCLRSIMWAKRKGGRRVYLCSGTSSGFKGGLRTIRNTLEYYILVRNFIESNKEYFNDYR